MSYSKSSELLFKILVVGEGGTGKTCLIRRYVHNIFLATNKATIGVDFALKDILHKETNRNVTLQLWDIAGQERYGQMTRVYYQAAAGAVVVADITRPETLDLAVKWKQDVDSKVFIGTSGKPIPCILLINKVDLLPNSALVASAGGGDAHTTSTAEGRIYKTREEMDAFCKEHGFKTWFLTSAKEDKNVDAAFLELVEFVLRATGVPCDGEAGDVGGCAGVNSGNKCANIFQSNRARPAEESKCPC